MDLEIVLIAVVAIAGLAMLFRRIGRAGQSSAPGTDPTATLSDISAIEESLRAANTDESFVVFIPVGSRPDTLNVQFCIEEGEIGLDWCLLAPVNISNGSRFVSFAESLGHRVVEKHGNGVDYLRVTDGDLVGLMHATLERFGGVQPRDQMALVVTGIEWPG